MWYFSIMSDSGTAVLDELLEPVTRALSRDVAQALVNVKASESTQARIALLAERCSEGLLTPAERADYESYVHAVDMISVLQAKARIWLAQHRAA